MADDEQDFDGVGFPPGTINPAEGGATMQLDAGVVRFMGRLMTGYEAQTRRVADLCDTLMHRLEAQEGILARSLETQIRLAAEREDLASQRHEREMEATLVKQRGESLNRMVDDARALLPLVGKRLLGVPLTGNDSHGLQDLLATMSEEQMMSVFSTGQLTLTAAQRALLVQIFQSYDSEQKGDNG